jgi:hydroxyacylglutathione hydrolase
MPQEIKTIKAGGANCYLVRAGSGFVLIDTGVPGKGSDLEKELESAGCRPGSLKLIMLTHGDHDHAGNAAYLREKYSTKIAMHSCDSGMVERGDMQWNRKAKPDKHSVIFKVMSFFVRPGKFDTFQPDLTIDESFDLNQYGFDARVLHLPGHSKGSIGILTSGGELLCGDLLYNIGIGTPFIDDLAEHNASVEELRGLEISTLYPGHGKPFPMERLMRNHK